MPDFINNSILGLEYIIPELILTGALILNILFLFLNREKLHRILFYLNLIILILISTYTILQIPNSITIKPFYSLLIQDKTTNIYKLLIDISAILCLVLFKLDKDLKNNKINDLLMMYPAMILGLHLLVSANNWLIFIVVIEMVSLSGYLLVSYVKQKKSSEAGIKYLLIGLIITAVMLYAISILYALHGTLDWRTLNLTNHHYLHLVACVFLMLGIGFKLGIFPVHFWMPDVFEGVPISIATYIGILPKIGATLLLFRFWTLLVSSLTNFEFLLVIITISTLIIGNLFAINQNYIKRLMAYSSIGHTGFIIMILTTLSPINKLVIPTVSFYVITYSLATFSIFFTLLSLSNQRINSTGFIENYAGLAKTHPIASINLLIAFISLIGLPITAGFWAKVYIFSTVMKYGISYSITTLLVVAVICTILSLFYYFRWIKVMFLGIDKIERHSHTTHSFILESVSSLLSLLIILLGFIPQILWKHLML